MAEQSFCGGIRELYRVVVCIGLGLRLFSCSNRSFGGNSVSRSSRRPSDFPLLRLVPLSLASRFI